MKRFDVPLLCEEASCVLNPRVIVIRLDGKRLFELRGSFVIKPALHQLDGLADVRIDIALTHGLGHSGESPDQQAN